MKISVLMPVYKPNKAYLLESIRSVVAQTFTDWELLILDDNPADIKFDYQAVLNEVNDDRIKFYSNGTNLGLSASMNKLIGLAQGELIAIQEQDDISEPTRFEKQVEFLNHRPDIDVVSSIIMKFGNETGLFGSVLHYSTQIQRAMVRYMAINNPVIMARKESLLKGKLYDTEYTYANDYELWSRRTDLSYAILPDVLLRYRIHNGQVTADKEKLKQATIKIINRNIKVDIQNQKIALVCIAKDEDNYIEEWLNYHLKMGFDKVYVYCNDWSWEVPKKYGDKVIAIPFNGLKKQVASYDNFLELYRDKYNFAAFIDVDEFIVLKQAENIKQAMYNYRDVACLRLPIRTFGNNGLDKVVSNNYAVIDRFTKARTVYESIGKYIINLDLISRSQKFVDENWFGHLPCTNPSRTTVWNGYYNYFINDEGGNNEPIELNHYITKTWEEYITRKKNTDVKKGNLNYPEDKIKVAYDMVNCQTFANACEYEDAYNFKYGKPENKVNKYTFKVNFLSTNNIPIIKELYVKESGVLICKDKTNMLVRCNCDMDGQAIFNNVNLLNGTYYIRGIWKQGYYNFTKPYKVMFENGKMYFEGKEITELNINNGF